MDHHLRLAEMNKRNANYARMVGNHKMANAYEGLAKWHEDQYGEQYAKDAAMDHLTDYQQQSLALLEGAGDYVTMTIERKVA